MPCKGVSILSCIFNSVYCGPNLTIVYVFASIHLIANAMFLTACLEVIQNEYTDENDDIDNSKVGMVLSLYSLISGVIEFLANPVWGEWSDHVGRRPILWISTLFWALTSVFPIFIPGLTGIMISAAWSSLFHPHYMMNPSVLYDLIPDDKERSRYFGFLYAIYAVAFVFGVAVVSVILKDRMSFSRIFGVIFILSLVQFAVVTCCYPETNEDVWIKLTGKSYRDERKRQKDLYDFKEDADESDDSMDEDVIDHLGIPGRNSRSRSRLSFSISIGSNPIGLDETRNSALLDAAVEKATRNPFKLVWSLRNESRTLKKLIGIRIIDVFSTSSWIVTMPIIVEEIYGWEVKDIVPWVSITVILVFISNICLKWWEQCIDKVRLFALALGTLLFQRLWRIFLMKDKTWMFAFQVVVSFPFGDLFTALNVSFMTDQIDPKSKGRVLGAVEAALMITTIIAQSVCPALFGFFVSNDAPVYLPTIPCILAFSFTAISVWLFYMIFYVNRKTIEQKTTTRETAIDHHSGL